MNTTTIIDYLKTSDPSDLFAKAKQIKAETVGNKVYLRGLIEYSNRCAKDCYYCGIRVSNTKVCRYDVDEQSVLDAAEYAWRKGFGSIVLQSGERRSREFMQKIEGLLNQIMTLTNHEIGITLSLGEQDEDTYKRWQDAGAKRYLLRIETSNRMLYEKLHPKNHNYDARLKCLETLQNLNYQVGTGVMIGLPFQTLEHLAEDLQFFQTMDVDMVGMGPYIEHVDTPLFSTVGALRATPLQQVENRLDLTLKMIALLRIQMPTINIAATTALQTLDLFGREKAIEIGANIIMPNLTPLKYRENYFLYDGKTVVKDTFDDTIADLEVRLAQIGAEIGYNLHGDSLHYKSKP
ncbi:MAG: [FeFe] hydrogenase H-cluster radical SAM maturase HydE [Bacteroidales bacterium]|jgi:biotin synthase|nr:[FeFe] hydrogenase H-cluster radical SAM maturase HydE [Bacteroidales bacterium]